jgi:hypothetical protein
MMLTIRLETAEWAKAWRAMIELGPVRLIADDPIYEVLPGHLELLATRGFSYEVIPARPRINLSSWLTGLLLVACLMICNESAQAQTGTVPYAGRRGTTVIAPPPGPGPLDPLSVAAYWGFWPNPVLARQPIGHQTIATSPNGYIYRPVYADDATAASIALPDAEESGGMPMPGPGLRPAQETSLQSAIKRFKSGDYEAAIDRASRALDDNPKDGDALLLLVQCYFALTNYEAAAELLPAALAAAPEYDWEKYARNYKKYYPSSLRFAMHLRALERFVELHPERREGHLLIGYQYGSLGSIDRALVELSRAKPDVAAEALAKHFTAAQEAPAPARDDDAAALRPARHRGRAF